MAAGLTIVQLLPPFPRAPWGLHVIGTPLIFLGSAVAVISYLEWNGNPTCCLSSRRGHAIHGGRI